MVSTIIFMLALIKVVTEWGSSSFSESIEVETLYIKTEFEELQEEFEGKQICFTKKNLNVRFKI